MAAVTLSTSGSVQSFTALGVTINQGGVAVDESLVDGLLRAASVVGVTLTLGGLSENLVPAPGQLFNPGVGLPAAGSYTRGQLLSDSAGSLFLCTAGPNSWVQLSGAGAIDGGSAA